MIVRTDHRPRRSSPAQIIVRIDHCPHRSSLAQIIAPKGDRTSHAFSGGRRCRGLPRRMRRPTRRIPSRHPRNHALPQAHLPRLLLPEKGDREAVDEECAPSFTDLPSSYSRSPLLRLLRREKVSRLAATDEASDAAHAFPPSSESRTSAGTSPMPSPTGEGVAACRDG